MSTFPTGSRPDSHSGVPVFDAVILAGGGGTRLGGVDKAALELDGAPMLDASLRAARAARSVVVVGHTGAALPPQVRATVEEPAGSGPAAAFVHGLRTVSPAAPWSALLACDVPGAPAAMGALRRAVAEAADDAPPVDGAVLVDPDGRAQWVLGLYRRDAVLSAAERASLSRHAGGGSLRALLCDLHLLHVPSPGRAWRDVDTWSDHEEWTRSLRDCVGRSSTGDE